jgi:hypothetical protein
VKQSWISFFQLNVKYREEKKLKKEGAVQSSIFNKFKRSGSLGVLLKR